MFAHQAVATDFVFIFGLFTVFGCAFGAFLTVNYTLNFLINKAESCTEDDQNMIGELTLIFSTLAFLTNSIIVTVLLYHHKKLNVMLSFILNLLVLDGIFALFGATFRGPGIINKDFYQMNAVTRALCPMLPYFITWVPPLCSLAIFLITVDRYIAIRRPLNYASIMTPTACFSLIAVTWVVQLIKFSVELYLDMNSDILTERYDPTLKRCEFDSKTYIFVLHIFYYLLPCFFMCLLYIGIFYEIWKSANSRKIMKRDNVVRKREESVKRRVKIIVTLSLITVGFFVAWFPYFYSLAESVLFGISRPGFKVTIVMFYFNLLWDSVVYAIRTPLIYRMLLNCLFNRRIVNSNSRSR
ncbi:hypothetical protein ACHWQZ_G003237 [Mnemiopsis leidyi]